MNTIPPSTALAGWKTEMIPVFLLSIGGGTEREVEAATYIAVERRLGFTPKPGCGPFATAGCSSLSNPTVRARIAYREPSLFEAAYMAANQSASDAAFAAARI